MGKLIQYNSACRHFHETFEQYAQSATGNVIMIGTIKKFILALRLSSDCKTWGRLQRNIQKIVCCQLWALVIIKCCFAKAIILYPLKQPISFCLVIAFDVLSLWLFFEKEKKKRITFLSCFWHPQGFSNYRMKNFEEIWKFICGIAILH